VIAVVALGVAVAAAAVADARPAFGARVVVAPIRFVAVAVAIPVTIPVAVPVAVPIAVAVAVPISVSVTIAVTSLAGLALVNRDGARLAARRQQQRDGHDVPESRVDHRIGQCHEPDDPITWLMGLHRRSAR